MNKSHTHSLSKNNSMTLTYTKNDKGQFVCPHCGITKDKQNTMHYHMRKHEEEPSHTCKVCKKGFLQKQTLDMHMKSRHPEISTDETSKKFKCPFDKCEFSALTKGNCVTHCLRVHFQEEIKKIMTVDEDTKEIECDECNETFSSSTAFYYHCKKCINISLSDDSPKIKLLKSIG